MRSYRLTAYAKINLYLGIVGDRSDGFHELVMVMQSVDLADTVTVSEMRSSDHLDNICLTCDQADVPLDETNLAWKAAHRNPLLDVYGNPVLLCRHIRKSSSY